MRDKLFETLEKIVELLETCGEQTRSEWFRQRLAVLKGQDSESVRFQAGVRELRSVLGGMGSFSDLSLNPGPSSGLTREEARTRQWDLAEDLDDAIRAQLIGSE